MAKSDKRAIAERNFERYQAASEGGHSKFVARAKRNDDFYIGNQWSKEDRRALNDAGRPALTLNLILSTVNAVIGEQLDRRIEPVFRAADGYEETAFALNKVTRCILQLNDYDATEDIVFADGVITGRGFVDIRLDFTKNIMGQISISAEDPVDIVIDPEAKDLDPQTWNEVFVVRWMTTDEVEVEYGKKEAEQVRLIAEGHTYSDLDNFDYFDSAFGDKEGDAEAEKPDISSLRRVKIIERQHYKLCEQLCFVDIITGDVRPVAFGVSEDEATQMAEDFGVNLVKRTQRRVRMTTSCDRILLHDDWSIYRSFTIYPFFPYFRRGRPFGLVDNLIDPQNLLNKSSSQELAIVNSVANSGWLIEEDSLVNMDDEDLETEGARSGVVVKYRKNSTPPAKITANTIPTGMDRISQKAAAIVREISSINAAMAGTARADQSGVAQEASIARGQVQVSVILSNLRRCRGQIVRKILELIQDFYTEERYFTMTGGSLLTGDQTEAVGINIQGDDGSILNDVTIGNYMIDIDYRPAGGTLKDKEFMEAMQLRDMGVQIPDHVVVKFSNLTERNELSEFLKQSQGFGEPTEEEAALQEYQMEHQIRMLKMQLAEMDAKVEVAMATAKEKIAKAESLEGLNEAQIELQKLALEREKMEKDVALRVALAARGHQNASVMNDKRIQSQVAMKAMDMVSAANEPKSDSKPPKKTGSK